MLGRPPSRARRGSFVQAHHDRLQDARALLRARRWGGAIYLAGYVVECLLKAIILVREERPWLPLRYWHHDLERLTEEAGLRPSLARPGVAEIRQRMALLLGLWDVTMRYGGTRFTREQAERALAGVEVIRRWLLGRLCERR